MRFRRHIIDEKYPSKVGAIYGDQNAARAAAGRLTDEGGFASEQIKIVRPGDTQTGRKLEPEGGHIRRTLLKSHFVLGGGFLILGLLLASYLSLYGPPVTRTSPVMTYIALGLLSLFAGLLLAGLITLRPDHDILIYKTEAAADSEQWTVLVHCQNSEEKERAKTFIRASAETL